MYGNGNGWSARLREILLEMECKVEGDFVGNGVQG